MQHNPASDSTVDPEFSAGLSNRDAVRTPVRHAVGDRLPVYTRPQARHNSHGQFTEPNGETPMNPLMSRRSFTKTSMAAAFGMTALQTTRVLGANDRVRLGVIGTGNRGCQVMEFFLQQPDCEIAAICDVSQSTMDAANAKLLGGKAATHSDFRKILDRRTSTRC